MTRAQWKSIAQAHEMHIAQLRRELDRANTARELLTSKLDEPFAVSAEPIKSDAAVRHASRTKRVVSR